MKTRLICLTLSVLMLLMVLLTGCSVNTGEEEEEATDKTVATLTMHVVTEQKVYYDEEELNKLFSALRARLGTVHIIVGSLGDFLADNPKDHLPKLYLVRHLTKPG